MERQAKREALPVDTALDPRPQADLQIVTVGEMKPVADLPPRAQLPADR